MQSACAALATTMHKNAAALGVDMIGGPPFGDDVIVG
jgi:hypothetical protein